MDWPVDPRTRRAPLGRADSRANDGVREWMKIMQTNQTATIRPQFKRGDKVRLNAAGRDNENYRKIAGKVLTVESVATAYMPASKFYAAGKPAGFHPGFDEGAGCALYDLKGVNCSLYEWELEGA